MLAVFRNNLFVLEEFEIPIGVNIAEANAFNITEGATMLHMGDVSYDASSKRNFVAHNTYPFSVKYEFDLVGDISDLIIYPFSAYVEANSELEIPFSTIIIPEGTEYGSYSGVIFVKVKRFFGKIAPSELY